MLYNVFYVPISVYPTPIDETFILIVVVVAITSSALFHLILSQFLSFSRHNRILIAD